jgi:hypothetical protein
LPASKTQIGNHIFRATGITAYLKSSGKFELAQQIANHESPPLAESQRGFLVPTPLRVLPGALPEVCFW